MMKNTTDNPTTRRGAGPTFWIVAGILALVVNVIIVWAAFLMGSEGEGYSREETEQLAADVKARVEQLEKQRELRREQTRLAPEIAEKVRKLEEEKRKPKIEERVERLAEIREEIAKRAEAAIQRLAEQTEKDRRELKKEKVREQLESLSAKVNAIIADAGGNFVFGSDTDGRSSAPKKMDDLRIYRRLLSESELADPASLPTDGLDHHWPILKGEVHAIADQTGALEMEVPSSVRVDDDGDAAVLQFTQWNPETSLNTGPFAIGGQMTFSLRIWPNRDSWQVLAATNSGGDSVGITLTIAPAKSPASGLTVAFESRGKSSVGRIHSGAVTIPNEEWSDIAVSIDTLTNAADLYVNGRKVTTVDPDQIPLATDLDTETRGADPKLADSLEAVEGAVENLSTEEQPTEAEVAEVSDAVDDLVETLDQQKENGVAKRDIDHAEKSAEALEDAAKDYAEAADEPGPDVDQIASYGEEESEPESKDEDGDLAKGDPAKLFDKAAEIEADIEDEFTKGRAAEIAASSDVSAEEALESAKAQAGNRPDLGAELDESKSGSDSDTVAGVDNHRDTMQSIQDELDAMVSRAEAMRRQSPGEPLQTDAAFAAAEAAGARSGGPGSLIDMTAITSAASTSDRTGMNGGSGAGIYRVAARGEGGDFDLGPKDFNVRKGASVKMLPGRRVTSEALRRSSLFVGTWYVIGPWDAGKGIDFTKRHPPENEIDLSAKYFDGKFADEPGHIDQVLSWRFYQSDRRKCEPPRVYGAATYYWFTEVFSDAERPVVFAIGQDDGSRVWLNDVLIYDSRSGGGSGIFDEINGLRRVTLRKGYNKILVRLVNGPAYAHQRLIIMPEDSLQLTDATSALP
jgi:hypothetical protein